MAENNRNFSIFLLVLALIGAALFYGCGSATSDAIPAIEYSITGTYNSEGLSKITSTRAVSGPSAGILIYSELDPSNYAEIDTINRTFLLRNLRPGKHYIVFKHIPTGLGGTSYICRSPYPVELTESEPVKSVNELKAVESTVTITGKVLNSNNQPITPTPTISLWGQTIEVNPFTGEFTTPKMPEGTTADLIINAVNYKQTTNTVTFANNPAYHEITAVETTVINVPPSVDVSSKDSRYNVNSLVILTAEAVDNGNKQLEFSWTIENCTSPNQGELASQVPVIRNGKHISQCYWYSPSENCLATITVTVRAKDVVPELSSKAKLQIKIGDGEYKPNYKPVIINTTIYPTTLYGSRQYTITCIATDTADDTLTHSLSISPSGSTLQKASSNTWRWYTPDLKETTNYTLNFEVRDSKGNTATRTRTVSVGESKPNEAPEILSQNPSETIEKTSGESVTFFVEARDPENEELSFSWSTRKGQIASFSDNGTIASMTWVAPYINTATSTDIICMIGDPYRSFVTATFTVFIKPDPNKKAPEIQIVIDGTNDRYNESIPLFKAGDKINLIGLATDTNQNLPIDASHFSWSIITPSNSTIQLPDKSNTTSYSTTKDSAKGNYSVRLTAVAVGLSDITGEQIADFRINTPPSTVIQCNGNDVDQNTGRMTATTTYEYVVGSKNYDVYQIGETINLIASCTDIESTQTLLDNNSKWVLNNVPYTGKNFKPELTTKGLNNLTLVTTDSKGEDSETSTYSFFVNTAPVFDIATSTKPGFINTDLIKLNAKVSDDAKGITMTWFISYKPNNSETFTDYAVYELPGSNPVESGNETLTSNIEINASTLMALGTDFRFRLIATDSMGTQTVDDRIGFSIVVSHKIADFVVASGTYSVNKRPYTFDELLPPLEKPYDFEANQKFSIRSGSDLWQDAMTWTWSDSFWNNNTPGAFVKINDEFVDAFTLNGYSYSDNFGTHTIRLEGKSNEYGIIASNSTVIFVNSTPKIEFNNMVDGTIRFDTGSNATFTITLKEDNKNEKLGLAWTIYDLDQYCRETTKVVYLSHDLDPATGNKSPVDMAGSNEKNVTINWDKISPTAPLTKGAKRVYVCAYDAYGKAATASVDILVNTLPKFEIVVPGTERKIKIWVPNESDNGENYEFFTQQYATAAADIPVYLIAGNPSMQLKFYANPTDVEDGNLTGEKVSWKYTDYNGAATTASGTEIDARFGIGLNTINVECRDNFYNYYKNGVDGDYVYNNMCVATYSADFYVWQSMAWDMEDVDGKFTATSLHNTYSSGIFFVQYGSGIATFSERYQLNCGVNTSLSGLIPGYVVQAIKLQKLDNGNYIDYDPPKIHTPYDKIITMFPSSRGNYLIMTDSKRTDVAGSDKALYKDAVSASDRRTGYIASYSVTALTDFENQHNNNSYLSFASSNYPGSDIDFPKKILSMTYCDSSDVTAGAMLLRDYDDGTGARDALAAYQNQRFEFLELQNSHPLYNLDNIELDLTENSKIRYLSELPQTITQKLFFTDTIRNRIVRLNADFSQANSIIATKPIDICTTTSKYIFSLAESGSGTDNAITVYAIDNASATPLTSFANFISESNLSAVPNEKKFNYRAGKVLNPKSIAYYTLQNGTNFFGGLIILEQGTNQKNRIQVIRANKADWLD